MAASEVPRSPATEHTLGHVAEWITAGRPGLIRRNIENERRWDGVERDGSQPRDGAEAT